MASGAMDETLGNEGAGPAAGGAADFDFFHGRWTVKHRRLRRRLVDDTVWDEFGGSCETVPILGGYGNVDDNVIDLPGGGYRAATLRTFDPATAQWSIWWIDGRHPASIDVPVRGRFTDGTGRFFCDDVFEGRPIRVRFVWSQITARSARWEQAFSADAGTTWETNWVMSFDRA